MALRDYQVEGIAKAKQHLFDRNLGGTIIHFATGLGKTRTAAEFIAQNYDLHKQRVMFVVHTIDLVIQTYFAFLEYHPEWSQRCYTKFGYPGIGIVMGEKYNQCDSRVVVGTPQTLSGVESGSPRLGDVLKYGQFDLIIIDEAHYGASQSYLNLCAAVLPAKRLGLTATPMRNDGLALRQPIPSSKEVLFDTICISRNVKWGITNGYLCPILLPFLIETNVTLPDMRGASYEDRARMIDVGNWSELVVNAYEEHGEQRLGAFFLPSVEHSKKVWEEFHERGIRAVHVDGDSLRFPDGTEYTGSKAKDMRKKAYQLGYDGEVDVYCNFNVLTHGWDMPPIALIGQARPTDNPVLWAQIIGRGTRLHESKENLLVFDYALKDVPLLLSGSLLGYTWDEKRKEMVEDPEAEIEDLSDGVDLRDLKADEELVDGNGIVIRIGNLFRKMNEAWYNGGDMMTLGLSEGNALAILIPNHTLANGIQEGLQNGKEFLLENPEHQEAQNFYKTLMGCYQLASQYSLWLIEKQNGSWKASVKATADSAELVFDYALPLIDEFENPAFSKKKFKWKDKIPSDQQLQMLRSFGIMNFRGTKRDASQLISYEICKQQVMKMYHFYIRKAGKYVNANT